MSITLNVLPCNGLLLGYPSYVMWCVEIIPVCAEKSRWYFWSVFWRIVSLELSRIFHSIVQASLTSQKIPTLCKTSTLMPFTKKSCPISSNDFHSVAAALTVSQRAKRWHSNRLWQVIYSNKEIWLTVKWWQFPLRSLFIGEHHRSLILLHKLLVRHPHISIAPN